MGACGLLGAAAAALINVCAVGASAPPEARPDLTDRPLFQRSDSTAPLNAEPAPKPEQEPVRTAPLPPSALTGIGLIGGLMLTAAVKRRKK